jgi:hypothetical protein
MDERVARLKTPEECEQFILNVKARLPDLVPQARRRAVELRAAAYGAESKAEEEAIRAIYAYEETLCSKHGKRVRASRTWGMIKRHGIIGAVERAVNRQEATTGYQALIAIGLQDFAFEAVVLRYPKLFSDKAVARAASRLGESAAPHGQ